MTRIALFALTLALTGCIDPIDDSDVIAHATEPAFDYNQLGRVAPTTCRGDRPSSYSRRPSGCARDTVFQAQVANPADLIAPRAPARPSAGPIGRAADRYLAGGNDAVTAAVPAAPADPYYRR